MEHLRTILIAIAIPVAFAGCSKQDHFGSTQNDDPVRAIIAQSRADANQSFTVNAAQGGAVFGSHGTIIAYQPGAFRKQDGSVVTGAVNIQLLEAMDPGDMVALNMQTVALYGGQKRMLVSGGEVRVRAEANGQQVTVAPGQVLIHFPAALLDPAMQRFIGNEDLDGDILWEADGPLAADTGGVWLPDSLGGQGNWAGGNYYTTPWGPNSNSTWPDYGYINCDHPMPPGGDSTDVAITVPSNFSGWAGCSVWIVIPDINCMVYMEVWNGSTIRAGFPLRVGLQGTIVAFSEQNGQYHSSFTPITIAAGHQQTIDLQPTTLAAYQQALQGL